MATTPTAVRDALATAIIAVAPTTLAGEAFARYTQALAFDAWVAENPAHCFRVFDLRFRPAADAPMVINGDEGRWRYTFDLAIAYPRVHYKSQQTHPVLVMDQIADEDFAKVWPALRDYAGATCVAETLVVSRESDAEITMLRLEFTVELWRTV